MKFDKQKWEAYVEEHGVDYLKGLLIINPISVNWVIGDRDILNHFDPLKYPVKYGIFTALGLDIKDFLIDDSITGVEALQALFDGKTLLLDGHEYWFSDGKFMFKSQNIGSSNNSLFNHASINQLMMIKFTIKE